MGAEAAVGAGAERDVAVGFAVGYELGGPLERVGVAVGGRVGQHDAVVRLHRAAGELGVASDDPDGGDDAVEAQ